MSSCRANEDFGPRAWLRGMRGARRARVRPMSLATNATKNAGVSSTCEQSTRRRLRWASSAYILTDMNSAAITAFETASAALVAAGPHATTAEKAPLRAAAAKAAAALNAAEKAFLAAAMKAKIAAREGAR